MDNLINIHCSFVEYRLDNSLKWKKTEKCTYFVDSSYISNMTNSKPYYIKLGGGMEIEFKNNRRFGYCVNKVISTSICGRVKRVYSFNYNQARYGI